MGIMENVERGYLRTDLPSFRAGDTVVVNVKIKEGDKERVQAFEGIVITLRGRGIGTTFTVRKVSYGVGVERVFPLHSPAIESIRILDKGRVRRAKLYYLRDLTGKVARQKIRSRQ
ncbi:MAG: 50S ribosomal protein L19 [Deltaproteobacteria bacterium]|nr:50S ribosomal protein L19 [Deltaproteobacteria bacterium]